MRSHYMLRHAKTEYFVVDVKYGQVLNAQRKALDEIADWLVEIGPDAKAHVLSVASEIIFKDNEPAAVGFAVTVECIAGV